MTLKEREQNFKNKIIDKYNRDDFEIIEFSAIRKKFIFKCLRCGKISTFSRAENLFERKQLCSCERQEPILKETGKILKYKFENWFDKIGNKKYKLIIGFTTTNNKIKLQCLKCGTIYNRSVKSILEDDRCLCCERKIVVKKTNEQFLQEVKQKYSDEYIILDKYEDAYKKIKIKHCNCGKIFEIRPHDFLTKQRVCPICKESKGEQKIRKILEDNKINFISQYRLEEFKRAPYDFYLIDFNILIEYQGIQHFQPVKHFGGEQSFNRQVEIDHLKKQIAESNNVEVIYISYLEYEDLEKILVQRLSQLGVELSNSKCLES